MAKGTNETADLLLKRQKARKRTKKRPKARKGKGK